MAYGLLLLRVFVGVAFFGHGTQKLFGWWGGYGPQGTGALVAAAVISPVTLTLFRTKPPPQPAARAEELS